jgi:hypothetical protein
MRIYFHWYENNLLSAWNETAFIITCLLACNYLKRLITLKFVRKICNIRLYQPR